MNSMDPLENLLANWTPRRPSPALRRRLFGATVPTQPVPWFQFAPATLAAAALALAVVLHPGQLQSAVGAAGPLTNLANVLSFRHAALQCANNAPVACFAWTNTSLAPSTNASVGGL